MNIPKGWHELTINQFQELLPSSTKGMNDASKTIHEINVLTGLNFEEIRSYTTKEIDDIRKQTEWLSSDRPAILKKRYKVNGVWYRFEVNARNVRFDQYAYVMEVMKNFEKDPETIDKNLHLLLANVSRPIKRNWLGRWVDVKEYDLKQMANTFKDYMTMDVASPIIVFFCSLSKNLTQIINDYSTKTVREAEQAIKDLQNTAGL